MKRHAFTLIELLVVISIIALLIAILLPALGAARTQARLLQNSTHVRGIQQGLFTYAQENKQFYPGIESDGETFVPAADNLSNVRGDHVQSRFALLIEGDFVPTGYIISPAETSEDQQHEEFDISDTTAFRSNNYSYAFLELSFARQPGAADRSTVGYFRNQEWSAESMNSQAIVVGDRITDVVGRQWTNLQTYRNIWSKQTGDMTQSLAFNDNHTETVNTALVENTNYGGISKPFDNLYLRNDAPWQGIANPSTPDGRQGGCMLIAAGNVNNFKGATIR